MRRRTNRSRFASRSCGLASRGRATARESRSFRVVRREGLA
ncbi:hypothetical protein HMPREF0762_00793 [Slackia exigua ATCC 700122]|uniref:Uncharacterized protein n=1 Tax=Slackia exigua (strain ATCC 700122 / DSM 15923 / CIP 105133 / JCM 11022 / KCTC 5966 / S-7) TaxID=649764 RepID=D0WG42_SLAES|nr:hypothetical protein HMPREF0762_00793 [Slackia exigua ATCC 700122]